jgi:methionyl aminopeptidase
LLLLILFLFKCDPVLRTSSSLLAKALTWPDEWTATTVDGGRSAQFEHTLLITSDGVEALTGKLETSPLQFWELESTVHQGYWLGTSAAARARAADLTANYNNDV